MRFYCEFEQMIFPKTPKDDKDDIPSSLKAEFEALLVTLYQHMLGYQIRSILRFYRNRISTFGRDLITLDDWKQLQLTIEDDEKTFDEKSKSIITTTIRDSLKNLNQKAAEFNKNIQSLESYAKLSLAVMEESRDIQKESRDIQKEFLGIFKHQTYVLSPFLFKLPIVNSEIENFSYKVWIRVKAIFISRLSRMQFMGAKRSRICHSAHQKRELLFATESKTG
jgi:hypothetical protein